MESKRQNSWHDRLIATMPIGSCTSSKAPHYLPEEPEVLIRAKGCRVWDDKGREFIDFRNGLGPITLGYCYPEIDRAVEQQLKNGIIYGHPSTIECEVSELMCEVIPCAEQAKFLKTGGEACAAAIRIARAYTGKKHIIQIGYNGWLNSLASNAKVLPNQKSGEEKPGVPPEVGGLYHAVDWNDQSAVQRLFDAHAGNVAAVIVAADYAEFPKGAEFYPFLREITRKNDSLLICDEIVTGFRVALGGVQEYFGVVPDLCVFAKGIANGMPLSVYAGSREVMRTCEMPGFSISSTYGGETLSLAACRAVVDVYRKHDVIGHIARLGSMLQSGMNEIFERYSLGLRASGIGACPAIIDLPGTSPETRGAFFRQAFREGVSLYNVVYVNFSHDEAVIRDVLSRLDKAAAEVKA